MRDSNERQIYELCVRPVLGRDGAGGHEFQLPGMDGADDLPGKLRRRDLICDLPSSCCRMSP
jgi:hypothetical protein